MKIYTKKGDDGTTGLIGGRRVKKTNARIRALGAIDELNACLGYARSLIDHPQTQSRILQVQNELFGISALIAGSKDERFRIGSADIEDLEQQIDAMNLDLPPLEHFILPGGAKSAAYLHVVRTVCRRAEVALIELYGECSDLAEEPRVYLNRLSDWLFVLARWLNHQAGHLELYWNG